MCDFAILSPMRWAGVGVEGGGVRNFISEFLRSFFCVLESCGDLILLILRPSHFKIVGRNLICWKWSSPPHTQHEWGEKLSTPIILGLTQFFPLSGWGWEVEEEKSHNKAHSSTQLSAHFPGNSFPYASRVIICLQTVWQCWETFCCKLSPTCNPFPSKRNEESDSIVKKLQTWLVIWWMKLSVNLGASLGKRASFCGKFSHHSVLSKDPLRPLSLGSWADALLGGEKLAEATKKS